MKIPEKTRKHLSQYVHVTEKIENAIIKHAKKYGIKPEICAWYANWEDFCSDWCDQCGYTRTQARKIFHGGIGEFQTLPNGKGIVRFSI